VPPAPFGRASLTEDLSAKGTRYANANAVRRAAGSGDTRRGLVCVDAVSNRQHKERVWINEIKVDLYQITKVALVEDHFKELR
jgi:hypothetical protein